MLILDRLQFKYREMEVLKDITFSLKTGEIGTLIGASGSGKTTLFKLLTGLLKTEMGSLTIGGNQAPMGHDQIACMMQEDLLLPWRTIMNNLMLTSELGKKTNSGHEVIEKAKNLLSEMNLSHCSNMFPHELSVGMKQRVSLARALLQMRPILLLDEPFGSLDVALREHMYVLLRQIQKKQNTTMLMVTHDFRDALSLSDHIFFLSDGIIKRKWEVTDAIRSDPAASGILLNEMRQAILNS